MGIWNFGCVLKMYNNMKKRSALIFLISFFLFTKSNAQLPIVKAVGGEGRNVNWPLIKKNTDPNGPGFFYFDCDQGVIPIKASSTLASQGNFNYRLKNINDYDPMTAWVEGNSDYGIGEYFEIKSTAVNVIYNGYQASPKSWTENSRVKQFKVYKNNLPLCILELKDEMGRQSFELPDYNFRSTKEFVYKFEILDVYKGAKWKDVAISEINLSLCCFSANTLIKNTSNSKTISKLIKGESILSVDVNTGTISNTEVIKSTKQTHLSLLKISSETKEIELTFDHPLYIKDFGFSSINRYMQTKSIKDFNDLINNIELLVWDENNKKLIYEKLKSIKLITGNFDTYSIMKLSTGNTFIANGFVTITY
jgi:hypothetical protein